MQALQRGSEREAPARRFGRALSRSMQEHGISERRLAEVAGIGRSALRQYRAGYNLPSLATGVALAAALDDDGLGLLIRKCRTQTCPIDGVEFVNEGTPQRYCSDRCKAVAQKKRTGVDTRARAAMAERATARVETTLCLFRESVATMCLGCEPEGACRTPDCALRAVSPLPMMGERRLVAVATPAPGPYGSEENRQRTVAAIREALARRWTPEARAEQARTMTAWHAGMGEDERAALGRKIAAGRTRETAASA